MAELSRPCTHVPQILRCAPPFSPPCWVPVVGRARTPRSCPVSLRRAAEQVRNRAFTSAVQAALAAGQSRYGAPSPAARPRRFGASAVSTSSRPDVSAAAADGWHAGHLGTRSLTYVEDNSSLGARVSAPHRRSWCKSGVIAMVSKLVEKWLCFSEHGPAGRLPRRGCCGARSAWPELAHHGAGRRSKGTGGTRA
jgi:hypothetical protein